MPDRSTADLDTRGTEASAIPGAGGLDAHIAAVSESAVPVARADVSRPSVAVSVAAIGAWMTWVTSTLLPASASFAEVVTALGIALLSGLVATALGFLVAVGLRHIAPRHVRLAHLAGSAVVGVVAGGVTNLVAAAVGQPSAVSPVLRVVVSAILATWVLYALDELNAMRMRLARERDRLVSDATTLASIAASQSVLIADLRAAVAIAVDDELAPARLGVQARLDLLDVPDADWTADPPLLGPLAHDVVRPLARLLDADATADADVSRRRVGVLGAVRAVAQTQPFRLLPVLGIYAIPTLPMYLAERGLALAVVSVLVGSAIVVAVLGGANVVMRRIPDRSRHEVVFWLAIAVLQMPSVAGIVAEHGPGWQALGRGLATVATSAAVIVLASSVGFWRERKEAEQERLRERVVAELVAVSTRARVGAMVARESARVLHGSVQARLTVCAAAIDAAVEAGDVRAYADALRRARAVLDAPLALQPILPESADIADALTEVVTLWRGLVDVRFAVEPTPLVVSGASADAVRQIVEEAVTNAIRHGGATGVDVCVTRVQVRLLVDVSDNGQGSSDVTPGLGSALISRLTDGAWSLTCTPGTPTRLHAEVVA